MAEPISASIAGVVLPAILGGLFGGGGASKSQNRVLNTQADLLKLLAQITQQQAKQDLPFRGDLYSALRQRQQQQIPTFQAGRMPLSNPYANVIQRLAGQAMPSGMPTRRTSYLGG